MAALLIEDFDRSDQLLSSVPLQFLVDVFGSSQDCSTPMVSPLGGSCLVIPPGGQFSLVIAAVQARDLPGNE